MEQLEVKQKQKLGKERDLSFDVMNILACISVIALHHNSLVHSFVPTAGWVQSLVIECLCYFCVPFFMMISGANLLDYHKKYDTAVFFRKRLTRVVIPWLLWSVIILLWRVKTAQIEKPALGEALFLVINTVSSNNKLMPQYWFFGELFACYLAMPVLSKLCDDRKTLWYIILLCFAFQSVLPLTNRWIGIQWTLDVPVTGSLILFVLLGYLLSTQELSRKQRIFLYVLGIAGVAFRFAYTLHFSFLKGTTDTTIKGYRYFHSVFYAVAVFVLGRQISWDRILPVWLKRKLPAIASCSFGVYLIHYLVMYYEKLILHIGDNYAVWRIPCIFLTYFICLAIVSGLRKIPVLKYLVG